MTKLLNSWAGYTTVRAMLVAIIGFAIADVQDGSWEWQPYAVAALLALWRIVKGEDRVPGADPAP